MLTLTFALSSAIMYKNLETKPINEKKLDCVLRIDGSICFVGGLYLEEPEDWKNTRLFLEPIRLAVYC